MLNKIWFFMIIASVVIAAFTGRIDFVSNAVTDGAKSAVELSIGMMGMMGLWSGIIKIAEKAGIIKSITAKIKPILFWIFPDEKNNNEAIEAAAMNISANFLGIGNAATPLGLKTMSALKKDGSHIATNSMVLFVVMNTASIQLVPATMIALRSAAGSASPTAIIPAVWCTSVFSFICAFTAAKLLEKRK